MLSILKQHNAGSLAILLLLIVLKAPQTLNPPLTLDQYRNIPPQNLLPLQIGVNHLNLVLIERRLGPREVVVVNTLWMPDFAQSIGVEVVVVRSCDRLGLTFEELVFLLVLRLEIEDEAV